MNRIHKIIVVTILGLVFFHVSAQKVQPQAHGLCALNEEPVFSCALQGSSRKTVSLCASPKSAQGERNFRYLYGRPSNIELEYPASGNSSNFFTRTHLIFASATGGYAYAFKNDGFKYILYAISGTGFEHSGLMVQREGQMRATRDMRCRDSTLVESSHELWDATAKWKFDTDIDAHGIPSTD